MNWVEAVAYSEPAVRTSMLLQLGMHTIAHCLYDSRTDHDEAIRACS